MVNAVNEQYMRAYMDGYTAALEKKREESDKLYMGVEDIQAAFDGNIGINKARQILVAVRHVCNGGKLDSSSYVLRSEFEYWCSVVDAKFLERLGDHRDKK